LDQLLALLTWENGIALVTLAAMEIVLGIDNIVFITILVGKLPEEKRAKIRNLGLILALVMRVGLLFAITWIMRLTTPLFTVPLLNLEMTGKSLILLVGGLFLIAKATYEIHHKVEGEGPDTLHPGGARAVVSVPLMITQILVLDLVFSLDSVITAVGMVKHVAIMIIAVLISVGVMIAFAGYIGKFVDKHPSIKMLALAFLVLIGVMLVAEGMARPGEHGIPKGYIYFAMAFSLGVEMLNIRAGTRAKARPAA
jgi:predicted tellurium resistance membrane protein TerC